MSPQQHQSQLDCNRTRRSREEIRWSHGHARGCVRGTCRAIEGSDIPGHAGAGSTEHFGGWERERRGDWRFGVWRDVDEEPEGTGTSITSREHHLIESDLVSSQPSQKGKARLSRKVLEALHLFEHNLVTFQFDAWSSQKDVRRRNLSRPIILS